MLKRVFVLAGAFGTILALAAVGCSGTSNDLVAGGSDSGSEGDGTSSFGDSGKKTDGGPVRADGGAKDSGTVIVGRDGGSLSDEGGVVVDAGTTQTLDAGSAVIDSGTVVEPDGGITGSCFVNSAAQQLSVLPPVAGQNRCTGPQITEFNTACLGASSSTVACNAVIAADGDCADCLFGGNLDGGLGNAPVLLPVGGEEQVNFDGCLVAISAAPADCRLQYQEAAFCAATTCATCTTDTSDLSCLNFSETDPSAACATDFPIDPTCAGYVTSLTIGQENECGASAVDFTTFYTAVATTMCGAL